MICPKCQFEQNDGLPECLKCGVVFAKLRSNATARDVSNAPPPGGTGPARLRFAWRELLLPIPYDINPVILGAKVLLLAALAIWGAKFILASVESNYAGQSFMHLVNLPFHEAGHIVFSPLGSLIKALGGTLGQLLMPAVCWAVLLLRTRDAFGAAVAQWWLAQSFMDIALYINDARSLNLVLLGGVTGKDVLDYHDWEFILRKLGLLQLDHALAQTVQLIGIGLMLGALLWAALVLWVQVKICMAGSQVS